jgi:hypothetical protein
MTLLHNGIPKQTTSLDKIIWKVPDVIAFLSKVVELKPGDLIYTSTPAGVGSMEVGDKIEVQSTGLPPCTFLVAPKVHDMPTDTVDKVLELAGQEKWGPLASVIREFKVESGEVSKRAHLRAPMMTMMTKRRRCLTAMRRRRLRLRESSVIRIGR